MSQLVKKIRTNAGDCQIDYNALANLPTISNPNLLINSDFRNPVNQRGKTTYTGGTEKCYTIDRWCTGLQDYSRTVEIVNGGVKVTNPNTTNIGTLQQIFEYVLPQNNYTLSLKVSSITGSATMSCGGSASATKKSINVGLNTLTITNATVSSFIIYIAPSSNITVEWAKLEQGTTATPFCPRIYAEEVALCKRFFQNVNLYWRPGVVNSAGTVISFTVDVQLRTLQSGKPLVTLYQIPTKIRTTSSNSVDTTLTFEGVHLSNGMLVLNIASSTSLEARSIAIPVDEFKVNIDAEIY